MTALIKAAWGGLDISPLDSSPCIESPDDLADSLARYTATLAKQLDADIAEGERMKRRGATGLRKAFDLIAPRIAAYADALAGREPVSTEPIDCPAVSVGIGAKCIRTDAGHVSHTFPPAEPKTAGRLDGDGVVPCGRFYLDIDNGDPCLLDFEHMARKDFGHHQARNSRWPVRDDERIVSATLAAPASPAQATIAYLKGERDDLGTEPPFEVGIKDPQIVSGGPSGIVATLDPSAPFIEPRGEITRTGGPAYVELGFSTPVTIVQEDPIKLVPEELLMQPAPTFDPFDDALPDPARKGATWRPAADPRPLWLPRESAPLIPNSIRVTHVRTGEECGMAYRLLSRDGVAEVPAWWNVGGQAVHMCAEAIETNIINGFDARTLTDDEARKLWGGMFPAALRELEASTPFPRSRWRAANKGAEGEDWWNEMGPLMVRDYSAASPQWRAEGWSILPTVDGPAMELEMRMLLPGGGEMVGHLDQSWYRLDEELVGHLDQAWYRLDEGDQWQIRVRDLKSGRELPTDTWQLEAYTTLLAGRLALAGMDLSRCTFSGVYYDARNAKDAEPITIDPGERLPEIQYRASSVLRMHETNNYPANPKDGYGGPCYLCPVRYACPIMATKG